MRSARTKGSISYTYLLATHHSTLDLKRDSKAPPRGGWCEILLYFVPSLFLRQSTVCVGVTILFAGNKNSSIFYCFLIGHNVIVTALYCRNILPKYANFICGKLINLYLCIVLFASSSRC